MYPHRLLVFAGLLVTPMLARGETAGRAALASKDAKSLPRISQVVQRAHELLGKESSSETAVARANATLQLIWLANHVAADPRFDTSPTLQQARGWLVNRLRRIKKGWERDLRKGRQPLAGIKVDENVLAQVMNAPGVGGAAAPPPGGNNGPPDYGPLLVQLIQDTISPASWDVNGGNSTIFYYRPGRALVVRAPQDLHGEVAPLLGQLRR